MNGRESKTPSKTIFPTKQTKSSDYMFKKKDKEIGNRIS